MGRQEPSIDIFEWLDAQCDWSQTALGPIDSWHPALKRAVLAGAKSGDALILWGEDLIQVYGPQWAEFVGDRHPEALGQPHQDACADSAHGGFGDGGFLKLLHDCEPAYVPHGVTTAERDGILQEVHWSMRAFPILDPADESRALGLLVTTNDLSDYVKVTSQLEVFNSIARMEIIKGVQPLLDHLVAALTTTVAFRTAAVVVDGDREAVGTRDDSLRPEVLTLIEATQACWENGCSQTGAGCRFAALTDSPPNGNLEALVDMRESMPDPTPAAVCMPLTSTRVSGRLLLEPTGRIPYREDEYATMRSATALISHKIAEADTAEMYQQEKSNADAKVENLSAALESNRTIGQAIGILMASHKLTSDEALGLLMQASQRASRKVREVAEDVIFTGALPENPKSSR